MKQEIAKYSYIMIFALIISSVFNYLYQVVMGILLPKHEFGILGVALAIFFIASVLTQNTFSWSGTRRMASSQMEEIPKIFKTTVVGNITLAFIVSILIIIYSYKSETYFIPNVLVALAIVSSAVTNSYASLLRAMRKFQPIASANIIMALLKFIFAVVLVMLGLEAVGGVAGLLLSIIVVSFYLAYHAIKINLPRSKGFVRDMISETFYVSIIFLGITFIINSSIVFMRWFSGSDVLAGDYNAALTIARIPFFITMALVAVIFSYISSPNDKREEYAFQSIKYIILFVFPICVSMAVDPETWLNLFFGRKYMGGVEALRLLSIGIGFVSLAFIISSNLVAFENLKVPAACLFVASIIQVVVVSLNGDPVLISALSVVVSSTVAAVLLIVYYVRRFYFKSSVKYVLKILIAYFVLSAASLLIHLNGRLLSLVEIAISFTIYFLILAILGLFDEKDVEVMFSPFPRRSVERLRKIVSKLNNIGL